MKVLYRQVASDDIVRQFRYYLLASDLAPIAFRFRESVKRAVEFLSRNPLVGPRHVSKHPQLQQLRSWPVAGFESIRIYYFVQGDVLHVVRILHSKRDLQKALEDA